MIIITKTEQIIVGTAPFSVEFCVCFICLYIHRGRRQKMTHFTVLLLTFVPALFVFILTEVDIKEMTHKNLTV